MDMSFDAYGLKLISAFVCVLIVVGLLVRRHKTAHISLMVSAFVIDLGLVLYLELARGVVESVPGREMSPLLVFHLVLSTIVLGLYVGQIVTGIRNARGQRSGWHAKVAIVLLVCRVGNLITGWAITPP